MKAVALVVAAAMSLALAPAAEADQNADDVSTLLGLTGRDLGALERGVDLRLHAVVQNFINAHPDLTGAQVLAIENQLGGVERGFLAAIAKNTQAYYAANLTDAQIRSAIAFFGSADGRAYIGATRAMARQNVLLARQKIPALVAAVRGILEGRLQGHSPAPAQPGPG